MSDAASASANDSNRRELQKFTAAAIQMDSQADVASNLSSALRLIEEAASKSAQLICLPENFLYMGPQPYPKFTIESPELLALRAAARKYHAYLLAGSIPEMVEGEKRHHNTSILFDQGGNEIARYRKIHLFDVDLPDFPKPRRESDRVIAGADVVVSPPIPSPNGELGRLGLAICYDLRFPELFRALMLQGATIIALPSNFTMYTGNAHWRTLVRARAIENQVYLIAPAESGTKHEGESHGHSLIVDPWGNVLAEGPERGEAVVVADIDPSLQEKLRTHLPSLNHTRLLTESHTICD